MRKYFFAFLLVASTANAETWLQIANLDSKGGLLFLDTASIDRTRDVRTASFKSVFTADRPIGEGYRDLVGGVRSYRWESSLGHFDCAKQSIAVSQSILHGADDGIVGRIEVDAGQLKFRAVDARSIGGLMLAAVCAPSTPDAQPTPALARITYIVNPDDYYPSGSRWRGDQGAPIVKVCVGPSGALLREPELTDTSGFPDLDGAAIKVAKANRYAAAVENGAPVAESCIKFKVKFVRFNR